MHRTYASSTVPVYLDATAKELLTEGRDTFERWGLSQSRLVRKRELCPPVPLVWGSRASHSGSAIECPEALRLGRGDRNRRSRHGAEAGRGGVGSGRPRRGGQRVHTRRAGLESGSRRSTIGCSPLSFARWIMRPATLTSRAHVTQRGRSFSGTGAPNLTLDRLADALETIGIAVAQLVLTSLTKTRLTDREAKIRYCQIELVTDRMVQ